MDSTTSKAAFRAVLQTVIKAGTQHSRDLAEDQKLTAEAGAVLTARIVSKDGSFIIVEDAALDGRAVAAHLRYVFKPHWEETELPAAPAPKAPKAKASAASDEDKVARIRALLAEGKTVSAIAREVGIGRAVVKRVRDGAEG